MNVCFYLSLKSDVTIQHRRVLFLIMWMSQGDDPCVILECFLRNPDFISPNNNRQK